MRKLSSILVCLGLLFSVKSAQAVTITLDFDSLPSSQGWSYTSTNFVSEVSVFSVDGTTLTIDTMGMGNVDPSYRYFDIVDENLPYTVRMTARVLQYEPTPHPHNGPATAFTFGAFAGEQSCLVSLNTHQIRCGNNFWDFDATQFHDYHIEAMPGVGYTLYIDNEEFSSGPLLSEPGINNHLVLGNASTYENCLSEITSYEFSQVPAPTTILLAGSGLIGLIGLRRKFRK